MAAGLEVTTHQAGLGTPQCAASTGATHRAGGARHIPDAQCRDAIHHARPALAREPPARRGDHGVSVGIRPVTYSGRAGALPMLEIPRKGEGYTTGGRGARAVVEFLT